MKALILDSQWIARAGLAYLLSLLDAKRGIKEASTLSDALALLGKEPFDICLVNPVIAGIGPLEVIRKLRQAAPEVPIAVVTDRESRQFALQSVEAGAQAFILKRASAEDIRRAVERVLAGEISLPSNLGELGDEPDRRAGPSEDGAPTYTNGRDPLGTLTARQRDVLALIATGRRNAEIGKELRISPRTVQIHVSTILKLLGVGNRTEAALFARKHGIGG